MLYSSFSSFFVSCPWFNCKLFWKCEISAVWEISTDSQVRKIVDAASVVQKLHRQFFTLERMRYWFSFCDQVQEEYEGFVYCSPNNIYNIHVGNDSTFHQVSWIFFCVRSCRIIMLNVNCKCPGNNSLTVGGCSVSYTFLFFTDVKPGLIIQVLSCHTIMSLSPDKINAFLIWIYFLMYHASAMLILPSSLKRHVACIVFKVSAQLCLTAFLNLYVPLFLTSIHLDVIVLLNLNHWKEKSRHSNCFLCVMALKAYVVFYLSIRALKWNLFLLCLERSWSVQFIQVPCN